MKRNQTSILLLCMCVTSIFTGAVAVGQERMRYPDDVGPAPEQIDRGLAAPSRDVDDADTATASAGVSTEELMQTQRGRELVDQLRVLLVSESTMGEKHPLYSEIQREIKETRDLLRNLALSRQIADEIEEESKDVKRIASALPAMQDKDLRRLILRLIIRVDDLEKEVQAMRKENQAGANRSGRNNSVGQASDSRDPADARFIQPLPKPATQPPVDSGERESPFSDSPFGDD